MTNASDPPLSSFEFLEPWLDIADYAQNIEHEAYLEIGPQHRLFSLPLRAVAQHRYSDDVLFAAGDLGDTFAVVHLTWTGTQESDPGFPETTMFDSLTDWAQRRMLVDHMADQGSSPVQGAN